MKLTPVDVYFCDKYPRYEIIANIFIFKFIYIFIGYF